MRLRMGMGAGAVSVAVAVAAGPLDGQRVGRPQSTRPTTHPAVFQDAGTTGTQENLAEQLPLTRPAERPAVPLPELIAAERKRIWKEFRAEYDAWEPADRGPLAHMLLRMALGSGLTPERRFALLKEAQELAAGAHDRTAAMKTAEAIAFYFDADALKEKMLALSAGEWPEENEAAARGVLDAWMELSSAALRAGRWDVAEPAARRAVAVGRHWGDDQWVRAAEAQLLAVHTAHDRKIRIESAFKTLSSRPTDSEASLLVGCDLARAGDWAKALALLKQCSDPVIRLAAVGDLANPTKPDVQVNLAEAWAGAAQRQPTGVQEAFANRARHWYSLAIHGLGGVDRQEIERRMRALPGGTIFDVALLGASEPRRIDPKGGPGGAEFNDLPSSGAILTGFRTSTGPVFGNSCISSLRPLFLNASGKCEGMEHGKKQGELKTIEAKAGYAVGGIVVKTGLAVDGFKIVFMRISSDHLDPKDKYESEWIGGRGGGPETSLGCDGKPVIGIQGRAGDGIDAIGLIQAP